MNKVRSVLKWALKAFLWMALIFVLIFILIAGLIQVPAIQNKLIHFATSHVSNKTHTRVEIKNISISFPKSIVMKGLFLDDIQKDTLIYAGEVKVNIALKDLLSSKINIKSFSLEDVTLNVKRKATDSLFNYNFLLTAFTSTPTPGKVPPPSPSKWTFNIDNVSLKKIRLHYDDLYGGMKATATLGNMAVKIDEIDLDKSLYSTDKVLIENMSASVQMYKPGTTLAKGKGKCILRGIAQNNSS
jgi:translocation and assembly module TamB